MVFFKVLFIYANSKTFVTLEFVLNLMTVKGDVATAVPIEDICQSLSEQRIVI